MLKKKYPKNLIKINGVYYIRYFSNDKSIKKSLGTGSERTAIKKRDAILCGIKDLKTEIDVIQKVARAKKIYSITVFPVKTLCDKFEKHLIREGVSPDTLIRHKYKWTNFLEWLKSNYSEKLNLNEITKDIAKEYADILLNTGISNKVYNETLNLLFRALDTFKEEAELLVNPFDKAYISRRTKNVISRKEFSEEQTLKLLESIPKLNIPDIAELEVLFHIGTWSGLRLKDACLLKWENVDFSTNNIFAVPFKTRKHDTSVKIPIHPALHGFLIKASVWRANEYVLPNLAFKYKKNNNSSDVIGKYIRRILQHNAFINTNEANRLSAPCLYGFHSLRYTFVCACAKRGVPATLVQEIVGHLNPAMTRHYTRFDNSFRQNAIKNLTIGTIDEKTLLKSELNSLLDKLSLERLKHVLDNIKTMEAV